MKNYVIHSDFSRNASRIESFGVVIFFASLILLISIVSLNPKGDSWTVCSLLSITTFSGLFSNIYMTNATQLYVRSDRKARNNENTMWFILGVSALIILGCVMHELIKYDL